MTNSALADMITLTQGLFSKTRVEYAKFCTTKQNRIKFPSLRGAFLLGNQEVAHERHRGCIRRVAAASV